MTTFTKSIVEQAALAWLESIGDLVLFGPKVGLSEVQVSNAERIGRRCV